MVWLATSWACFFAVVVVSTLTTSALGWVFGVPIRIISIGAGPLFLKRGLWELRVVPITTAIAFKHLSDETLKEEELDRAWGNRSPWLKIFIIFTGNSILVPFALLVLGWSGWTAFASAFEETLLGAVFPFSSGYELLERGKEFLETTSVLSYAALVAVKNAAANLLPFTGLNGYGILRILGEIGRPYKETYSDIFATLLFLPTLGLIAGWILAIGNFFYRIAF